MQKIYKSCKNPFESIFFSKEKDKIISKEIQSPWITAGIKKSSKHMQWLYEKFLKCRSERNEDEYKNYK